MWLCVYFILTTNKNNSLLIFQHFSMTFQIESFTITLLIINKKCRLRKELFMSSGASVKPLIQRESPCFDKGLV